MKMTPEQFARWPNKAVTLLGMSGVGKTTLANRLPKTDWFHFSADYRIATKYLEEPILDNIKKQAMQVDFLRDLLRSDSIYICSNITVHNLAPLSSFLGKLGNPALGGLSLDEFRERQRLHREAEIAAMRDVVDFIRKGREIYGYAHFVNDTSGSICELDDDETIEMLADNTLMVYIRADDTMESTLTERAKRDPKPLYYQKSFLDRGLRDFLAHEGLSEVEEMDPDKFVRWIFPRLVAHRRPLYQAIADRYGYTVEARDAEQVKDEADFLALLGDVLARSTPRLREA